MTSPQGYSAPADAKTEGCIATPGFWAFTVGLPQPSLQNNTADTDRLLEVLQARLNGGPVRIDFELILRLPCSIRKWQYRIGCVLGWDRHHWVLLDIYDPASSRPVLGLAIDLGTTRVALRLIDLATGTPIADSGFDNPQIAIGADILTRIHYAGSADTNKDASALSQALVAGLNRAVADLCRTHQLSPQEIMLAAVAGNTAMTHLFLGLEPRWIIREPYIPVVNTPGLIKARELGLDFNPAAHLFVFPNIGSYFGGDLIAGLLETEIHRREAISLLVDVGTNAEVVLGNNSWLIACAGAAGPALEGGVTRMGMLAAPGVIDRLVINPITGSFDIHTIGGEIPRGICGSGLIDLLAGLFQAEMVDIRGRLLADACGERFQIVDELARLLVVPAAESATGADLTISQADLDSLIRSKAAMYTILETLTAAVGLPVDGMEQFFIAGTFGTVINPRSAITIGMIPDLEIERLKAVGNSSLNGATRLLTSRHYVAEIEEIRRRITYLELNVNQEFMNRFSAAKFLPHTDPARFPSVRRRGFSE